MDKTFNYNTLYEDIILEVESKTRERESVLCMGRQDNVADYTIGHLFSGVNFWGRNCVRRARQRGGNCEVSGILKRGCHSLPVLEIYTSEYMIQPTSKNLATLEGFPLIKTLFIK